MSQIKCPSCGGEFTSPENVTPQFCQLCAAPLAQSAAPAPQVAPMPQVNPMPQVAPMPQTGFQPQAGFQQPGFQPQAGFQQPGFQPVMPQTAPAAPGKLAKLAANKGLNKRLLLVLIILPILSIGALCFHIFEFAPTFAIVGAVGILLSALLAIFKGVIAPTVAKKAIFAGAGAAVIIAGVIFYCSNQLLITCSLAGFRLKGTAVTGYYGNESTMVIPDGVTEIHLLGVRATSIKIPSSVTEISYLSGSITSLDIPDSVTKIGMIHCQSLTNVKIPGSVKVIPSSAFAYCPSLTSVTIEDGVERIEEYAFSDCPLTTVNLPRSVVEVNVRSFRDSSDLSVYIYRSTRLINDYPSLPHASRFYYTR